MKMNITGQVRNKCLKYITKLRKCKPLYILSADLGRYPIKIVIKSKMIGYLIKLGAENHDKLSFEMYQIMLLKYSYFHEMDRPYKRYSH